MNDTWKDHLENFSSFLQLEKSLSSNSVEAYINDVQKIMSYLSLEKLDILPSQITLKHLKDFIAWLNSLCLSPRSQARVVSGIKAFFKYLILEEYIDIDPAALLEAPRTGRKLPEVLSLIEIDQLISAIDLSSNEGHRNKAMLETLYSCGLRVSEMVNLRISNLYLKDCFIRVTGKGDKERLVPISPRAIKDISLYMTSCRSKLTVQKGFENFVFLNRRGKNLTRVMVFTIIRNLADQIQLNKTISPHTFRHSFATHLIDGGADLRAVQEMLGHESIITTEIYSHLDREYLRDAIISYHPRS